jgi:SAM-dependent methyltransferase
MDESPSYPYFEDVNQGLIRLWGNRTNLDVLDIGCGFATTSHEIQKLGNRVTGIDSSAAALTKAAQRVGRVLNADIVNADSVHQVIGSDQFDVLIFADVLEHLPWPQIVLREYMRYLRPGGTVIVSLPNVGLWAVRLSMLAGRFEYADTGVMDRTHLRFFTRRSARALLEGVDLIPLKTVYNPGIIRPFVPLAKRFLSPGGGSAHNPAAILESKPYKLYMKTAYPLESAVTRLWPGLLAFQMITESKRRTQV